MYERFARMYVCVLHACLIPGREEEGIRVPGLELKMAMSYHVSAGTPTWVSSTVTTEAGSCGTHL